MWPIVFSLWLMSKKLWFIKNVHYQTIPSIEKLEGLWMGVSDIRKTYHIVNKQKIATLLFLSIECDDKVWVGSDVYKCNAHLNKNIETQVTSFTQIFAMVK